MNSSFFYIRYPIQRCSFI